MDLSALAPWATAGFGTGAGFLMVKWFVEWLSGRWDKQRETIDTAVRSKEWLSRAFVEIYA